MLNKLRVFTHNLSISSIVSKIKVATSLCILCDTPPKEFPLLCNYCLEDLPQFNYSLVEGNLLNWPSVNKILPNHTFDHLFSVAPHSWPYSNWVGQLKYQGRFDLANLLGSLLYKHWSKALDYNNIPKPDLLISVPLHTKKWRKRGFNQAHLIANKFSKLSEVTYKQHAIQRISNTESQVGQTGASRRKNMKNAFQLSNQVAWPEHVMIIDDVITTGSTVSEISTLLKTQGVKTVSVLTITISLPDKLD